MGAGKPNGEYGVREFKRGFGSNLVNYGRFVKLHKPLIHRGIFSLFDLYQKCGFKIS
jgi:lipid II:glycine glycyltransferase (peptidoglycan interpeptide bridge formation enzyme)